MPINLMRLEFTRLRLSIEGRTKPGSVQPRYFVCYRVRESRCMRFSVFAFRSKLQI
jgi:hypothetical protein